VLGPIFPLSALGVLFLEVRGILEEDGGEFDGGWIGEDRAAIAVTNEAGKPAGVVEMRVGKDDVIDGCRFDRERLPVALLEIVGALKESAIDKQAFACGFDEIFGTGDTACGAEEGEFWHEVP